ncbi:hypothetical protein CEXT_380791, partial [Caerostris extrusa]
LSFPVLHPTKEAKCLKKASQHILASKERSQAFILPTSTPQLSVKQKQKRGRFKKEFERDEMKTGRLRGGTRILIIGTS